MKTLQKWGALAAFVAAGTYVFGFVILLSVLAPSSYGMDDADPVKIVGFLVDNSTLMSIWNLVIYVLNGVCLVVLALAFADRFKPHAPALGQAGLGFGWLWATLVIAAGMVANVGNAAVILEYSTDPDKAVLMWQIFSTVENGLGGGNEIVGAVWAHVLGVAMLRTGLMSKPLGYFSIVIGIAGLSTLIPGLSEVGGAVFGLGYIVWFAWVGVELLRPRM